MPRPRTTNATPGLDQTCDHVAIEVVSDHEYVIKQAAGSSKRSACARRAVAARPPLFHDRFPFEL
jgi:hypothetical protein